MIRSHLIDFDYFLLTTDNGKIDGSIYGVSGVSPHLKLLLTFQALGDIAFAYPYSLVFLEIQVNILF